VTAPGGDWRDSAACLRSGLDFYPAATGAGNKHTRMTVKTALKRCFACPVRLDCLRWAVENKEYYGIWGGTTERERRAMIENGITADDVVSIVVPEG